MEFLNNIKRITLFWSFMVLSISLFAQEAVIKAFKESYAFEESKEYSKAIEKLRGVYEQDSYEQNLRLGWLYYLSGKLDESAGYYSKTIALKPYAIEPRFGMAKTASAQGKWNDVLALYNKIVEIDPQNSVANYHIGLIYYTRQNYETADIYLEKVINLYPFDYDTLLLLAWNKIFLQKTKEAKILFGKVLLYNPDDKSALEGLKLLGNKL